MALLVCFLFLRFLVIYSKTDVSVGKNYWQVFLMSKKREEKVFVWISEQTSVVKVQFSLNILQICWFKVLNFVNKSPNYWKHKRKSHYLTPKLIKKWNTSPTKKNVKVKKKVFIRAASWQIMSIKGQNDGNHSSEKNKSTSDVSKSEKPQSRFADYFVVCGLDLDSGLEVDKYAGKTG
jgi:hypothetical protein